MMMGTPRSKITIAAVVPVYNGQKYLAEAIESILSQERQPDEIIFVDDGSTDDGAGIDIIKRYQADNPKIQILHKPNGGQGSARNYGIAFAKSSHIALLDQDDAWYPHHLKVFEKPFLKPSRGFDIAYAYSNLDQIKDDGTMVCHSVLNTVSTREHPKRTLIGCLMEDMMILPGASLISREAFEKVGGFDERLAGYEDDDLFLRMYLAGYRSIYINEPLTKWRIHSSSTSFSVRMARSRQIFFDTLVKLFPPDVKMRRYYIRDLVVPRFMPTVLGDLIQAVKAGNREWLEVSTSHLKKMLPYMPLRRRLSLRVVATLLSKHHSIARMARNLLPPPVRGRLLRLCGVL